MSFAIFKGEKNMSELVSRLYRLQGKGSQATAKHAAEALLAANPQLKDFGKLAPGSPIILPDTGPPVQASELANQFTSIRSAAVGRAQQTITAADQQFATADARALDAAKSFLALAKSPDLRTAAANNPDLKQALAQMTSTTQEMLKDLEADLARPQQSVKLSSLLSSLLRTK